MLSFIEQQAEQLMSDRTASGDYQIEKTPSGLRLVPMSFAKSSSSALGSGIFFLNS